MISCKRCGRKFRNKEALGGHMSRAHASGNPSASPQAQALEAAPAAVLIPAAPSQPQAAPTAVLIPAAPSQPQAAPPAAPSAPAQAPSPRPESERRSDTSGEPAEGEGEAEQIRRYWARGYGYERLIKLGFKPSTIRQEIEKLIPPDEPPESSEAKDDLPMVRKVGGGMEVMNPEALLRRYMDGDDEQEFKGMMKMRAAMLMVMDMLQLQDKQAEVYAKSVEPVLKLMKEAREQQDAAAARARGSGQEIAQAAAREAADETAKQVVQYLAEKKPDIASVANPLQGVMARALETTLTPMLQKLLTGLFLRPQPGQAQGAGSTPAPSPQPAQAPPAGSGLPPGWEDGGVIEGTI